ncbi:MAG: hypothetical protein VKP62_11660 [Candidatus Sericytochromatia bacterium]|nr:hypothetical protein [Candidatus Sericytochromatia bacterium]
MTHRRTLPALLLATALVGCSTTFAGTTPTPGTAAGPLGATTSAALPAGGPLVGSAVPGAGGAGGGQAPAADAPLPPELADHTWGRVRGFARLMEGEPFGGATISGFDLGSNEPVTIRATADLETGAARPTPPVTDADGNFDLIVQDPGVGKVVRLVMTRGEERLITVTDPWPAEPSRVGYRLQLRRSRVENLNGPIKVAKDENGKPVFIGRGAYNEGMGNQVAESVGTFLRLRQVYAMADLELSLNGLSAMGAMKLQLQRPEQEIQAGISRLRWWTFEDLEQTFEKLKAGGSLSEADRGFIKTTMLSAPDARGLLRADKVEDFRKAMSLLGKFGKRDALVTEELKVLAAMNLVGRLKTPIAVEAKDFPLDRVAISLAGVLTFTGQTNPVRIWGPLMSHFIPTPTLSSGGSRTATSSGQGGGTGLTPSPSVSLQGGQRLAFLRQPIGGAQLVVTRSAAAPEETILVALTGGTPQASGVLDLIPSSGSGWNVAQTLSGSRTLYVASGSSAGLAFYEPDSQASGLIFPNGGYALAADSTRLYAAKTGFTQPVRWISQANHAASSVLQVAGANWLMTNPTAMTVFDPAVDGVPVSSASPTLFIGTDPSNAGGAIFSAQDGAATAVRLASGLGVIEGLAYASPVLYVNRGGNQTIVAINVNTGASSVVVSASGGSSFVQVPGLGYPFGLTLDDDGDRLFFLKSTGVHEVDLTGFTRP